MDEKRIYNEKHKYDMKTAILIDGAFYRKRAFYYTGEKEPAERAKELFEYCLRLLSDDRENRHLYRIFYYDCPPIDKSVYNPITKKSFSLKHTDDYKWTTAFYNELKKLRKVALRMGRLSEEQIVYNLKYDAFKKLMNGTLKVEDIAERKRYHYEP